MLTKYRKLIKIGLSALVFLFVSNIFSALGKRGVDFTDLIPTTPIAHADISFGGYGGGFVGDAGDGGGGGGGCDAGDGGGGGGGGDCF